MSENEAQAEQRVDEYHRHEVMDRAAIIRDMWYDYIVQNAGTKAEPNLAAQADKILDLLEKFYNDAAEASLINAP